jgi:AcrR family transcriptional regulator
MPRVIKHPELRRLEILDQALALFCSRGYDNASLNDLIAEAGISKGAFYHYFPSKEALVAALADRFARQVFTELQPVLDKPGLDPLARLNAFLSEASRVKADMAPTSLAAFSDLFRPENRALYQQIAAAWEALFRPALTAIIAQGVKARTFDTFDPEGVADMIQELASSNYPIFARLLEAVTKMERQEALGAFEKRLRLHGIAIDRVLGLPDGSVHMLKPLDVRKIMAALPRKKS